MSGEIGQAARAILSDLPGYLGAMFFFMVSVMFRYSKAEYTLRERIELSIPRQTAWVVVFSVAFIWFHRSSIGLVTRARPAWGWYVSALAVAGAVGTITIVRNHRGQTRRPVKFHWIEAESQSPADQYHERMVTESKVAAFWLLLVILAVYWLYKIGQGEM